MVGVPNTIVKIGNLVSNVNTDIVEIVHSVAKEAIYQSDVVSL